MFRDSNVSSLGFLMFQDSNNFLSVDKAFSRTDFTMFWLCNNLPFYSFLFNITVFKSKFPRDQDLECLPFCSLYILIPTLPDITAT